MWEWEETPPQTGTSLPFIWPPPEHLQTPPPFDEPVLPSPPPESLLAREMKLDALRCEDPTKHRGVQVYDSLNRPPRTGYPDIRGATRDEDMPRWYVPTGPDDDTVVFESRFESGNLRSAERIGESEYNLHLAFDINTDRHTQWFYFRMSNLRKGRPYKLNMQNLMKTEAVYNLGMQPLAYSHARAQHEGVGWYRTGSDACYFKNQLTRAGLKPFWTLTFVVQTDFDQDTLYLAHCFPYRYTDLQRYLRELESSPLGVSCVIRRRSLCETLAGNVCDLLTITSPGGCHAEKKGIVISARVHPGETNASWMMKGVLDFLGSDCHCAVALRDKFIFKIIPILNPDGVIVGNYRCSLAGGDLNRQYADPKRELFPEVMNLKQMIANFSISKEVLLFVDLHGHSKKSNIFMYGVENPTDEALYMRERVIPSLLDETSPLFNLADCTFDIGKGKEGCGRVVVRKQLGIVNAYTMEASFMGADQGEFQGIHFHQGHYEAMGHALCEVLLHLVDTDQSKVEGIVRKLKDKFPIDQSRLVLKQDGYGDHGDDSNSSTSSDDSDSPSHRRPPHRQVSRQPSKPSSPSARSGPRPPSSAGRGKKIILQREPSRGTVVNGSSSSGGANDEEGKRQTPRTARSESTLNSSSGPEHPAPAASKAPPSRVTTPVHNSRHAGTAAAPPQKSWTARPSTPTSMSKAAGAGKAAVKRASTKSGGSKSAPAREASVSSKTSVASKQKEQEKEKAPHSARSDDAGARSAGTQQKGKAAPKAGPTSSAGAGATTTVRGGSAKLAAGGRKSFSGRSAGGTPAKASKVAAVPSLVLAKGEGASVTAATANGKKAPKKGVKAKGAPAPSVGASVLAQRPKSSPASRSVSSPRRASAAAAAADAPRRAPSAPSKTGATRADAGSASTRGGGSAGRGTKTKAKAGGGATATGGSNRKKEVLPLPPLKSKTKKAAASSSAGR